VMSQQQVLAHLRHPELPTGVADPPRMKLCQNLVVVGVEVGNFLGACSARS
jgi:hypothetical protein